MKLKHLKRWTFPHYPRELEVRKDFYKRGKRLPKELSEQLKKGELKWITLRKKEYLCDLNDQRIEKSVKVKLNSQLLYSATMTPRERATIVRGLKEYFGKLLATPKQFPLFLSITFLCPREDIEDLDNLAGIYQKCFIDSLKSRGRKTTEGDTTYYNYPGRPFPDDNVDYLSCLLQRWYSYPTRYLVFDLYEMSSYQEDRQLFIDKLFAE